MTFELPTSGKKYSLRHAPPDLVEAIRLLTLPDFADKLPLISKRGDGALLPDSWTVKVYRNKRGHYSVVCNDFPTLGKLLDGTLQAEFEAVKHLKVVEIDDAGWGFPIGGAFVGAVCDGRLETNLIEPRWFTEMGGFTKAYLDEYARRGLDLIERFQASPETHRICICTGYINVGLKDALRAKGFHVTVGKIVGPLQDGLEDAFRAYIKSLGYNGYADPKELTPKKRAAFYTNAVAWGKEFAPHLLKTMFRGLGKNTESTRPKRNRRKSATPAT
jgi:hypothetical protein